MRVLLGKTRKTGVENMRRSQYTDEQIILVLREQESEVKVFELCRNYGVSEQRS